MCFGVNSREFTAWSREFTAWRGPEGPHGNFHNIVSEVVPESVRCLSVMPATSEYAYLLQASFDSSAIYLIEWMVVTAVLSAVLALLHAATDRQGLPLCCIFDVYASL